MQFTIVSQIFRIVKRFSLNIFRKPAIRFEGKRIGHCVEIRGSAEQPPGTAAAGAQKRREKPIDKSVGLWYNNPVYWGVAKWLRHGTLTPAFVGPNPAIPVFFYSGGPPPLKKIKSSVEHRRFFLFHPRRSTHTPSRRPCRPSLTGGGEFGGLQTLHYTAGEIKTSKFMQ